MENAEPIKILFLSANPQNTQKLNTSAEFRLVYEVLQHDPRFKVISRDGVTAELLQETLLAEKPHILHFSGHGGYQGSGLVTQTSTGDAHLLPLDVLGRVLHTLRDAIPLRILVLNACWTLGQVDQLRQEVDAVVGMTQQIDSGAATKFAEGFYIALREGLPLANAVSFGKNRIELNKWDGLPNDAIPNFVVRESIDPESMRIDQNSVKRRSQPEALPDPSNQPRSSDHIFISYSHADRALVDRLADDLRKRGHTVWIDFEGIRGGDVWRQAISDGISASAVFLLILSPDSVNSEWVGIELDGARQFNKKVVPLLVRPLQDERAKTGYANLKLESIQYIDFTLGYDQGFQQMLLPTVLPRPQAGVPGHCQRLIAQLAKRPWGLDHYIQSPAKLLPIDASPYEDGTIKGVPERLLERLWKAERLLVLGEPGMGKTVALERLAWELASADPPILPIFIALRDYHGGPLLDWVRLALLEPGEITHEAVEDVKRFLRDIPFTIYFLLDGLNEVAPTHRDDLLSEITRLSREFPAPHTRLVVTSRVQDDSWRSLRQDSTASVIRESYLVQPIRPEQARNYLRAHLDSDELWSRLDEKMRTLASNPLLLWLTKEAWLGSRNIPGNRGALYSNFVARMLRRDDDRKLGTSIPERTRLQALEKLALTMHTRQVIALPMVESEVALGDLAILTALRINGLLTGDQIVRFAPHQTVQEHFTARAIQSEATRKVQSGGFGRLLTGRGILNQASNPWWFETFIQLAGLTNDPNALARAIAEVNPWLAWWCTQDGKGVEEATRKVIEAKSIALVESTRVADRRGAVEALARLNSERTIAPLIQLVADENAEVRKLAARALIPFAERATEVLEKTLADVKTLPPMRLRIGFALNEIGDPRPGVGLRSDGLPDVVWCEIPDDGEWTYQNAKHEPLPKFYMAKYPVTYRQFQAFVDAPDGYANSVWWDGLHADGLKQQQAGVGDQASKYWNHPREGVSWWEAMAFCRWLSAKAGYEVRLPTEAEWEKAARGRDGRAYPYGPDFDSAKGNTYETGIGQTSAVGIFPQGASPYGILDLSGNVWEWTLTEYSSHQSNDISNIKSRVLRGGSWHVSDDDARAPSRNGRDPDYRSRHVGFRLVCAAPVR